MNPRPWLILAAILIIGFGLAVGMGWIRDATDPIIKLPDEKVADHAGEYRRVRAWWVALIDGVKEDGPHEVYVRVFAHDGKLALCAYLPMRDYFSQQAQRWLDEAKLTMADLRLPARFVLGQNALTPPGELRAGCIVTARAFTAQLGQATIDFTGQALIQSRK